MNMDRKKHALDTVDRIAGTITALSDAIFDQPETAYTEVTAAARQIDVLRQLGWDYAKLEEEGIASPVIGVDCKYKKSTTFGDTVFITVGAEEYNGVRLTLKYEMENEKGDIVATGHTNHCFFSKEGKMLRLQREYPQLHEALLEL